jgi:hypothetical protein
MQIQKVNAYQNQRNNSQQAFGMKIDLSRLSRTNILEESSARFYRSGGKLGTCRHTPRIIRTAILNCKKAIARIKPTNGTVVFHRSSHSTGYNHLDIECEGVHRTVTDNIFDDSKDLGKFIIETVREVAKIVRSQRRTSQRALEQRVQKITAFRVVESPKLPDRKRIRKVPPQTNFFEGAFLRINVRNVKPRTPKKS